MASFNKVILMGNLTRDVELRMTSTNMAVAKFGLAVNRRYTTKDGEQREETTFVDIDAFGRQAEVLAKYAQKGTLLLVEGRLKLDQWESNQGEKRSKLTVTLENFQFGGSSSGGRSESGESNPSSASPPPQRSSSAPPRESKPPQAADDGDLDEEVPF